MTKIKKANMTSLYLQTLSYLIDVSDACCNA